MSPHTEAGDSAVFFMTNSAKWNLPQFQLEISAVFIMTNSAKWIHRESCKHENSISVQNGDLSYVKWGKLKAVLCFVHHKLDYLDRLSTDVKAMWIK